MIIMTIKLYNKLFHVVCIGLTSSGIKLITSKQLYWLCSTCRSSSNTTVYLQNFALHTKQSNVSKSNTVIEQLNQEIEILKKEISNIIQEPFSAIVPQINLTTSKVCNLIENKLETIEAYQKGLNVEINGLPFNKKENLRNIVSSLCDLIELQNLRTLRELGPKLTNYISQLY